MWSVGEKLFTKQRRFSPLWNPRKVVQVALALRLQVAVAQAHHLVLAQVLHLVLAQAQVHLAQALHLHRPLLLRLARAQVVVDVDEVEDVAAGGDVK